MTLDTRALRELAHAVVAAGIAAADPAAAVARHLRTHGLSRRGVAPPKVLLLGAGKAVVAMGRAVEAELGEKVRGGLLIAPHGARAAGLRTRLAHGRHPEPDRDGEAATAALIELAGAATADDHAVIVLSGGASALLAAPAQGLTVEDLAATTAVLLRCGADIHDINTVRRHLSGVAGGWLAAMLHPCPSTTLILSDVIGDDPAVIASGPTTPDTTTFAHALSVLTLYEIADRLPPAVVAHLEAGAAGARDETPKPGEPWFEGAQVRVVASVADAIDGALREALRRGLRPLNGGAHLYGEAAEVGARLAAHALRLQRTITEPVCLVAGGESTVTEPGSGIGGRNQELALAAAVALAGYAGVVAFSVGTDGVDGPTTAAGAVVDGGTAARALHGGVRLADALARHDSFAALKASGDLLLTGPTGTNVMDLVGCVVAPLR